MLHWTHLLTLCLALAGAGITANAADRGPIGSPPSPRRLLQRGVATPGQIQVPASCQANGCARRKAQLVCGTDGMTYQSPCFAMCQGVGIASLGRCADDPAATHLDDDESQELPDIAMHHITKFATHGYKYLGKGRANPSFVPGLPRFERGKPLPSAPDGLKVMAVRYVFESNDVYVSDMASSLPSGQSDSSDLPVADADQTKPAAASSADADSSTDDVDPSQAGGRRKLAYNIGADNRVRVTPTTAMPWRPIGQLVFNIDSWGNGDQCTGVLIDRNSVLTAGHCVHGGPGGSFVTGLKFMPGRDGAKLPYGAFTAAGAKWVTTYNAWMQYGDLKWDMAVFHLSSNIGDKVGWFNMTPSDTYTTRRMFTAGYPGDKPENTMWKAECQMGDSTPADEVTVLGAGCDVYSGQSGSPIWQSNFGVSPAQHVIRGIISHQQCDSTDTCFCCTNFQNFATQLTTKKYIDAMNWKAQG